MNAYDENKGGFLEGRRFLVTAGPTVEAIDPVRYISNHSTGKMGYAIAAELASRGARVVLVSGPVALSVPEGVECVRVVSAEDMYLACVSLWPSVDGAVMCAAVADYTPAEVSPVKLKKAPGSGGGVGKGEGEAGGCDIGDVAGHGAGRSVGKDGRGESAGGRGVEGSACEGDVGGVFYLPLKPTRDIAGELGRTKRTRQILAGFALETDNEEANALGKLRRKNLDFIVLNSLRDEGAGFGTDTNRITIFGRGEFGIVKTVYPLASKRQAAVHIADRIEGGLQRLQNPL